MVHSVKKLPKVVGNARLTFDGLVHNESYCTYWKLGRVEKLIQGCDGQIRAAVVRVTSGSGTTTLMRPVQLTIPT